MLPLTGGLPLPHVWLIYRVRICYLGPLVKGPVDTVCVEKFCTPLASTQMKGSLFLQSSSDSLHVSFGMNQNRRWYIQHPDTIKQPGESTANNEVPWRNPGSQAHQLAHLGVTHSPCLSPFTTPSTILLSTCDLLHPGHLGAGWWLQLSWPSSPAWNSQCPFNTYSFTNTHLGQWQAQYVRFLAVAWFSWYCPFYSSSKWHLNHKQTLMEKYLWSEITNLPELHTKVTSLRKKDSRGHLVRWQISRSHLFTTSPNYSDSILFLLSL